MKEENDNKNKESFESFKDKSFKDYSYYLNKENRVGINGKEAAAVERNSRIYVILGWVCAAFALFAPFYISPLFAIVGVTFGVLLNKQIGGSGSVLIISNVVLAITNIVLGILFVIIREMMMGYL